jgi:ComF family protein
MTGLPPFFARWRDHLPARCLLCTAPLTGLSLCQGCATDLPWNRRPCLRCGLPLNGHTPCEACPQIPFFIRQITSPFVYAPPCDKLILSFKHQARLSHGHILGHLLAEHLARTSAARSGIPDAIIPVPLHWRRLQQRGFNQSRVLAGIISDRLDLPVCPWIRRSLKTSSQQQLGRHQRLHNLAGAFSLSRAVDGLHIALVDDVVTTGSTISAIGERLHAAGAKTIEVWCLARTPLGWTGGAFGVESVIPASASI